MREKSTTKHKGIGLIEVMVALLVLSMGFLVSANMQLRGIRSNQESYYQSQAMMLANDMMDRMRNNRAGVMAGEYNNLTTNGAVSKPDCADAGCSGTGLMQLDRFEWSANFRNLRGETVFVPRLPPAVDETAASGTISAIDANGIITITLRWMSQEGDTEAPQTLAMRFAP